MYHCTGTSSQQTAAIETMPAQVIPAEPNGSAFLHIPTECRLDILRCLLLTSRSRQTKWTLEDVSNEELSRRCNQKSPFRSRLHDPIIGTLSHHRSLFNDIKCNEIAYDISPAILRVCRKLRDEGTRILYQENLWCALRWDGIGHAHGRPNVDLLAEVGIRNNWIMDTERFKKLQQTPESCHQSLKSSLKVTLTPAVDQSEQVRLLPVAELDTVVRALYLAVVAPGNRVMAPSSIMVSVQGNGSLGANDETISRLHRIVPSLASFLEDIVIGGKSLLLPDQGREDLSPTLRQVKHMCDTPQSQQINLHVKDVIKQVAAIETTMKGQTLPQTTVSVLLPLMQQILDIFKAYAGLKGASLASSKLMKRLGRLMAIASWHLIHLDVPADCKALLKYQFLYGHLLQSFPSPVPDSELWAAQVKQRTLAIKYKLGCEGAMASKPIKEEHRLKVSIV